MVVFLTCIFATILAPRPRIVREPRLRSSPACAGLTSSPPLHLSVPLADYFGRVSAEREELKRLVDQLADDRVPAVLAEARRQIHPQPEPEWPPPWFASFSSGRSDLGSNHDDLLAEGFGRS